MSELPLPDARLENVLNLRKVEPASNDSARGPLTRTGELAKVLLEASQAGRKGEWRLRPAPGQWELHPAARTFQALRILVNRELANLDRLLAVLPDCLKPGGSAAIISFHSGEDRRVLRLRTLAGPEDVEISKRHSREALEVRPDATVLLGGELADRVR